MEENNKPRMVPFSWDPDIVQFKGPKYIHSRKTFELLEIDYTDEGLLVKVGENEFKWMKEEEYKLWKKQETSAKANQDQTLI